MNSHETMSHKITSINRGIHPFEMLNMNYMQGITHLLLTCFIRMKDCR